MSGFAPRLWYQQRIFSNLRNTNDNLREAVGRDCFRRAQLAAFECCSLPKAHCRPPLEELAAAQIRVGSKQGRIGCVCR